MDINVKGATKNKYLSFIEKRLNAQGLYKTKSFNNEGGVHPKMRAMSNEQ